jgi:hypothetical protein
VNRTPMMSVAGLVKNGLPLDYIETLNDAEILAWTVCFGQLEGSEFDWHQMKWRREH